MASKKKRTSYPPEYRQRILDLHRAGRTIAELAAEFEPSGETIRLWVKQAELDSGQRTDGITTNEREELSRLRRENRVLREEREILKKQRHGSRRRPCRAARGIRIHEGEPGPVLDSPHVRGPRRVPCRVLCLGPASSIEANAVGCRVDGDDHGDSQRVLRHLRKPPDSGRVVRSGPTCQQEADCPADEACTHPGRASSPRVPDDAARPRREACAKPALDLVRRDFTAVAPNRLWVGDITYVPTDAGFLYLAVVLDVWSRRIVGWAMATHLRTELVLDALRMAREQRAVTQVIYHSDQGCQYTSFAYGAYCRAHGITQSMGQVGDAYDNAMCESFFASLECELIDRVRFATPDEARAAVFRYIEGWYNTRRRHSAIGYLSPINFERANAAAAELVA